MTSFDPQTLARIAEEYLGKRLARPMIQVALVGGLLGIAGIGLKWFFSEFVGGFLWPGFANLFGGVEQGISLDNIEVIIVTMVAAIIILVVAFVVLAMILGRAFWRRVVPQAAIDNLAELRSAGISILNTDPEDGNAFPEWHRQWQTWRKSVCDALNKDFTKAEALSFERLGVFSLNRLGHAINDEHGFALAQLTHQLAILEDLIRRHQDRR